MTTRGPAEPCQCQISPCEHEMAALQAENAEWKRQLDETRKDFVAFQQMHHREAASLRERVDELRTELESHANQEVSWKMQTDALLARATAAEGERDRLRDPLERARSFVPPMSALYHDTKAAIAAIPHTEGEASAPPATVPTRRENKAVALIRRALAAVGNSFAWQGWAREARLWLSDWTDPAEEASAPPKETTP